MTWFLAIPLPQGLSGADRHMALNLTQQILSEDDILRLLPGLLSNTSGQLVAYYILSQIHTFVCLYHL